MLGAMTDAGFSGRQQFSKGINVVTKGGADRKETCTRYE
jgi:hypothetical protein